MIDPRRSLFPHPRHDQFREPEAETSRALMLEMVGVGKRVLELGCSNGYMSRLLRQRNCQVTGVEADPLAATEARAYCEEVIVADLDARPLVDLLPGTPFDVAIFGDVLEHLRDPWRVFDETRAFLKPGSFAVLSIPNIAHGSVRLSLLRASFDYQPLGLLDSTHLRFFSLRSIHEAHRSVRLSLLRGSFDYQPEGRLDSTHLRFFTLRSIHELCMRSGYRIEEIRRTKAELFSASDVLPQLDPADFDDDLVAKIRSDPEHDTVQFIVKAVPLNDDERVTELIARICAFDVELHAARERNSTLQDKLDAPRDGAADLDCEAAERRDDIASLAAALAAAQVMHEHLSADLRYQDATLEDERQRSNRLASRVETERQRSSQLASEVERDRQQLANEQARIVEMQAQYETQLAKELATAAEELARAKEERVNFEASVARLNRSAIEQTRAELRRVLEEIAQTDAAIQATYASRLWVLKRLLGGLRRNPLRKRKP